MIISHSHIVTEQDLVIRRLSGVKIAVIKIK